MNTISISEKIFIWGSFYFGKDEDTISEADTVKTEDKIVLCVDPQLPI